MAGVTERSNIPVCVRQLLGVSRRQKIRRRRKAQVGDRRCVPRPRLLIPIANTTQHFSHVNHRGVQLVCREQFCLREIKMRHNCLCWKDVFQNAVRHVSAHSRPDHARSLRNAEEESKVWSSEMHLNRDNAFIEAFFANSGLVSKRM